MISVGHRKPQKGVLISSGTMKDKVILLKACEMLVNDGVPVFATKGTHDFLKSNGIISELVFWPDVEESPNALNLIRQREVDMVINIPKNLSSEELQNDYTIRRAAIDYNIPLLTNARLASALVNAFLQHENTLPEVMSWNEY